MFSVCGGSANVSHGVPVYLTAYDVT